MNNNKLELQLTRDQLDLIRTALINHIAYPNLIPKVRDEYRKIIREIDIELDNMN
jgi:hypothetical protein